MNKLKKRSIYFGILAIGIVVPSANSEIKMLESDIQYTFRSQIDSYYTVIARENLTSSWQVAYEGVVGVGRTMTIVDPIDAGDAKYFRAYKETDWGSLVPISGSLCGYQKIHIEPNSTTWINYPFISSSRSVEDCLGGMSYGDEVVVGPFSTTYGAAGWGNPFFKLPRLGRGFIYLSGNQPTDLVLLGEIPYMEAVTQTYPTSGGFLASPYPFETTINELISSPNEGDVIHFQDGSSYQYFGMASGWFNGVEIFDGGELVVDTGVAIRYEPSSPATLNIERPYPAVEMTGFEEWLNEAGYVDMRDESDCPDGDNIANLLKYTCGFPAGVSSSNLFTHSIASNSSLFVLEYTKAKNINDAIVYPEWTDSLTNSTSAWATNNIELQYVGITNEVEIWSAQLSVSNTAFMRLTAETKEE